MSAQQGIWSKDNGWHLESGSSSSKQPNVTSINKVDIYIRLHIIGECCRKGQQCALELLFFSVTVFKSKASVYYTSNRLWVSPRNFLNFFTPAMRGLSNTVPVAVVVVVVVVVVQYSEEHWLAPGTDRLCKDYPINLFLQSSSLRFTAPWNDSNLSQLCMTWTKWTDITSYLGMDWALSRKKKCAFLLALILYTVTLVRDKFRTLHIFENPEKYTRNAIWAQIGLSCERWALLSSKIIIMNISCTLRGLPKTLSGKTFKWDCNTTLAFSWGGLSPWKQITPQLVAGGQSEATYQWKTAKTKHLEHPRLAFEGCLEPHFLTSCHLWWDASLSVYQQFGSIYKQNNK